MSIDIRNLTDSRDTVNKWMERFGVRFGVYKHGTFKEQLFPFDSVPRIIDKDNWQYLEKGLQQRVRALNLFLWDVYHDKKIVRDGVVPEDFVYASKGYTPQCEGIDPVGKVYAHIAGIDLVEGKNNQWYVLEDNLRIPSGASYPMIARRITRKVSPETFSANAVADNRDYADMLAVMMEDMKPAGGLSVIFTPGRFNSAFFEHSYLAEKTGAHVANGSALIVENEKLYYLTAAGEKERVGAVYRRISDEYLDPMTFNPESVIGISSIFDVYRKGNVALLNAPGNGIADDKGIYYFVPKMIKYYLGEEPVLHNAPTYLPFYEEVLRTHGYYLSRTDGQIILARKIFGKSLHNAQAVFGKLRQADRYGQL